MPRPAQLCEDSAETQSITSEELVEALTKKDVKIAVLDVRTDQEFNRGHIVGASHTPSDTLLDGDLGKELCTKLLKEFEGKGVEKLVIHCMYSQSHGPAVLQSMSNIDGITLQLIILEGGFHKFMNTITDETGNHNGLLEGFQPHAWRRTKSHGLVDEDAVQGLEALGVNIEDAVKTTLTASG